MSKKRELDFMHYISIGSDFKQTTGIGDKNPFTINSHLFKKKKWGHHISSSKQLQINPILQLKHILIWQTPEDPTESGHKQFCQLKVSIDSKNIQKYLTVILQNYTNNSSNIFLYKCTLWAPHVYRLTTSCCEVQMMPQWKSRLPSTRQNLVQVFWSPLFCYMSQKRSF